MQVVEERPRTMEVGDLVIAYSKHTGFQTDVFNKQFERIGRLELSQMGARHTIYVNIGNLYPGGAVQGWVKAKIDQVEVLGTAPSVELRIRYTAGGITGSRTTKRGTCEDFVRAINEKELIALVESLPLSKTIHSR